jgi:hypothetical protein
MNDYVYALAVSGTDLYAGGTGGIAKWNGSAWSALGFGVPGSVFALAVSGTDLYAGGRFTTAGGVAANQIAKWDGNAWSALGSGMSGSTPTVSALAADGAGHLFVGGDFRFGGTTVSPFIAQANIDVVNGGSFGGLVYSPATGFSFTFSDATIGEPYRIQVSPDLPGNSWIDFTNFTYTGPRVITDGAAASIPMKFFRAVNP